jgi:hypothetical protein
MSVPLHKAMGGREEGDLTCWDVLRTVGDHDPICRRSLSCWFAEAWDMLRFVGAMGVIRSRRAGKNKSHWTVRVKLYW